MRLGGFGPIAGAMERFTDGGVLPAALRGGIAALGNFDGFHRGHQAVVGRALERARAERRPAIVVTFDPHPARLFVRNPEPFALTSIPQRMRLFEAFGADAAVVLSFDLDLAALTPDAFVERWLVEKLGLAGVVTGEDFTYGRARSGNVATLSTAGARRGFTAEAVTPVRDGEIISSTRVREALKAGDCATAARLLSRPYTIEGIVEHGAQLGRTLDFPTANLSLGEYQRPAYGVYAVRGRLEDGSVVDGVANLGIRPMIEPPKELLETYLLDWEGTLYGQLMGVELHAYLRPEWKLDGLDALKAQIAKDCEAARRALGRA